MLSRLPGPESPVQVRQPAHGARRPAHGARHLRNCRLQRRNSRSCSINAKLWTVMFAQVPFMIVNISCCHLKHLSVRQQWRQWPGGRRWVPGTYSVRKINSRQCERSFGKIARKARNLLIRRESRIRPSPKLPSDGGRGRGGRG